MEIENPNQDNNDENEENDDEDSGKSDSNDSKQSNDTNPSKRSKLDEQPDDAAKLNFNDKSTTVMHNNLASLLKLRPGEFPKSGATAQIIGNKRFFVKSNAFNLKLLYSVD
jgi:hypothetical protein